MAIHPNLEGGIRQTADHPGRQRDIGRAQVPIQVELARPGQASGIRLIDQRPIRPAHRIGDGGGFRSAVEAVTMQQHHRLAADGQFQSGHQGLVFGLEHGRA